MSNIQQARDIYDAFNRGDIAIVLGAFDLGIEWREAEGNPYEPSRRPRTAPGAITQNLFVKLGRTGAASACTPASFHEAGDTPEAGT